MRAAAILVVLLAAAMSAAPAGAARSLHHSRMRVVSHGDRIPRGADRRRGRLARMAASPVTSPLADGWCGAQSPADDVVDQAAAGNAIKVVYAHPVDVGDNFAQYAPKIEAAAKAVQQAFLDATDGDRTLRFDVGTSCGANYVDIEDVALPRPAAAYPSYDTTLISSDLSSLVNGSPSCPTLTPSLCSRDFLVFADGVYKDDGVTGIATRRTDDRPGAANASNAGGLFAYVWGDRSSGFSISPNTTAEHETLHNLGAVQAGALHSSGSGHCYDGVDVMCYDDRGSYFINGGLLQTLCPGAAESTIDCDHDDYFNPNGDVLDASDNPIWNIDDSKFLCATATCITGDLAPVASFSPPAGARAGTPSTFDGTASSDEAAPLAAYSWDVNGDGVPDGTGPALSYTYATPGTYTASLTVTDVGGARATTTRSVTVAAPVPPPVPPPVASLVVKRKAAPLSAVVAAAQSRLRRMGGLRALLRGRALRISYTPAERGRLAVRLVLGPRTLARATTPAISGRAAVMTLRLTRATRHRLRRAHGTPRVRLAFTKR